MNEPVCRDCGKECEDGPPFCLSCYAKRYHPLANSQPVMENEKTFKENADKWLDIMRKAQCYPALLHACLKAFGLIQGLLGNDFRTIDVVSLKGMMEVTLTELTLAIQAATQPKEERI